MPFLKTRTRYLAYFLRYGDLGAFWGLLGPKKIGRASCRELKPSQCPRQARRLGNGLGMPFLKTRTRYLAYFLRYGDLGAFWGLLGPKTRVSAADSRFKPSEYAREVKPFANGMWMPFLKTRTRYLAYFLRYGDLGAFWGLLGPK